MKENETFKWILIGLVITLTLIFIDLFAIADTDEKLKLPYFLEFTDQEKKWAKDNKCNDYEKIKFAGRYSIERAQAKWSLLRNLGQRKQVK